MDGLKKITMKKDGTFDVVYSANESVVSVKSPYRPTQGLVDAFRAVKHYVAWFCGIEHGGHSITVQSVSFAERNEVHMVSVIAEVRSAIQMFAFRMSTEWIQAPPEHAEVFSRIEVEVGKYMSEIQDEITLWSE